MAEHTDLDDDTVNKSEPMEYSLDNENRSKKGIKEREHQKTRQQKQSAIPSYKPPTGQQLISRVPRPTGSVGLLGSAVSFSNTSEEIVSKTAIPRSHHIDTSQPSPGISHRESSSFAQNEDRSESSLALSDQVRHHSTKLRDAVFAEWLAEKGSHMKKERETLQLKKKRQEQAKVEKMVIPKF